MTVVLVFALGAVALAISAVTAGWCASWAYDRIAAWWARNGALWIVRWLNQGVI